MRKTARANNFDALCNLAYLDDMCLLLAELKQHAQQVQDQPLKWEQPVKQGKIMLTDNHKYS